MGGLDADNYQVDDVDDTISSGGAVTRWMVGSGRFYRSWNRKRHYRVVGGLGLDLGNYRDSFLPFQFLGRQVRSRKSVARN